MHLPRRDIIATGLVAAAGLSYLLWAICSALPGMSSTQVTGVAVLALGFAASASAVVPGFGQLLHGSKTYLAMTSLVGLAAAAGIQMPAAASGAGLTIVMAAVAVLRLVAIIHHGVLQASAYACRKAGLRGVDRCGMHATRAGYGNHSCVPRRRGRGRGHRPAGLGILGTCCSPPLPRRRSYCPSRRYVPDTGPAGS